MTQINNLNSTFLFNNGELGLSPLKTNFSEVKDISIFGDDKSEKDTENYEAKYKPVPKNQQEAYDFYKQRDGENFWTNEVDTKSLVISSVLDVSDKDELEEKSGEELFEMFDDFKNDYTDKDMHYMRSNAALIKLLSNASSEQIEDFMNEYKNTYGEDEFKALGGKLLYAGYAQSAGMVTSSEYEDFMQKAQENPDLFPQSEFFAGGISNGVQWL